MSEIKENNNNAFCCTLQNSTHSEILHQWVRNSGEFNLAPYPASKSNTISQGKAVVV